MINDDDDDDYNSCEDSKMMMISCRGCLTFSLIWLIRNFLCNQQPKRKTLNSI